MAFPDTQLGEALCGESDFIAQAVVAYRQVKAWREAHPDADLTAIEKQVRQIRRSLMGSLIKELLDTSETRPDCPKCGKAMSFQADREIDVRGLEGDFDLERGYYYCRSCEKGLSPLDKALGLEKGYTPLAMKAITDSGAKCPSFDETEEQVEQLSGLFVSSTTIRALTYARGAKLAHRQEQEAAVAMEPLALDAPELEPAAPPPERVAVSQDGAKIRTYEDWREVKISTTSVVEVEPAVSPDEPPRVSQTEHSYRAGIWTSEELRGQHWADVQARRFDRAKEIIALGDGAVWIWENFAHCYPGCVEILDWIHAKDRIWEAADAAFGASSTEAKAWVSEQLEWLAKGEAMTIRQAMRGLAPPNDRAKDIVRRVGQYFEDHAHRMRYELFRQAGYPIGSGTVESAAKNVVESRMKRSGQRWAVPNANALLALRAELLSTALSHSV